MVSGPISRTVKSVALAGGILAAQPALSCGFHMLKPEKTSADWLVDAPHLVFARPDPENPLRYSVETALRGAEGLDPIPFLVDTGSRRRLELYPEDAMLLAVDEEGEWVKVTYADADFRALSSVILAKAESWSAGAEEDRFRTFAALLDHQDPVIRRLALSEVDKAPYGLLRSIDLRLSAEEILDGLWTPYGYVYRPVRILLLGISGSETAREEVYSYVDRARGWDGSSDLGPYATALIELDGAAGIDRLDEGFLADISQPLTSLDPVLAALAEHSAHGDPALAPEISAALGRLIQARPESTGMIARQFAARSDWSLAPLLEPAMAQRDQLSSQDLVSVAVYLAQAKAAVSEG